MAGNFNPNARDISSRYNCLVTGSNNVIGAVDPTYISFTGTTKQIGTEANPVSAGVFPLTGTGAAAAMGLHFNSLALNKGTNAKALAYDQRGVGYPREAPAGQPDIGFRGHTDTAVPRIEYHH